MTPLPWQLLDHPIPEALRRTLHADGSPCTRNECIHPQARGRTSKLFAHDQIVAKCALMMGECSPRLQVLKLLGETAWWKALQQLIPLHAEGMDTLHKSRMAPTRARAAQAWTSKPRPTCACSWASALRGPWPLVCWFNDQGPSDSNSSGVPALDANGAALTNTAIKQCATQSREGAQTEGMDSPASCCF